MSEPIVGRRYKHFKGDVYEVLRIAAHSESNAMMVVYRLETDGSVWTRALESWLSHIVANDDLCIIDRFQLIETKDEYI